MLWISLLVACSGGGSDSGGDGTAEGRERDPAASFALIELYTAQSLDSALAVEDWLRAEVDPQKRVFAIAWHISAFDDQKGWADTLAEASFDNRHGDETRRLGLGLTAPLAVINGTGALTGELSQQGLSDLINDGLDESISVGITAWPGEVDGDELSVDVEVVDAPDNADLHVVLVEDGTSVSPDAGQTAGQTFTNDYAARDWRDAFPIDTDTVEMDTSGVDLSNASIVAFVQDSDSGAIIGATAAEVE